MRRFTALINPISGGGRAAQIWKPVAQALAAAEAPVTEVRTRSSQDAMAQARKAAERGDVVVAVGGDGLVRDTTGGAALPGGTIAIVPGGRGNDLAARLELPTAPAELADMLLNAPAREFDLLDVNGILAPGNVYIGIDSMTNKFINRYRRIPARLIYRIAPIRAVIGWRPAQYTLTVDGTSKRVRAHTVLVANSGRYGDGLNIVPSARPDDGVAQVMIVRDVPIRQIVKFMAAARKGEHIGRPEVNIMSAKTVTVDADRPIPVCADGDEVTSLPATIRLRPKAIRMIVP